MDIRREFPSKLPPPEEETDAEPTDAEQTDTEQPGEFELPILEIPKIKPKPPKEPLEEVYTPNQLKPNSHLDCCS